MIIKFQKSSCEQITLNFNSEEFKCKCKYDNCIFTYIDIDHVNKLQSIRNLIGKEINILSGFRCTKHNEDCGGKKGSYHLIGKATDVYIPGFGVSEMSDIFKDFDGLGEYKNNGFIHVDSRGYRSRWKG